MTLDTTAVRADALHRHAERMRLALRVAGAEAVDGNGFQPPFALPAADERLREYFSVADLRFTELDPLDGHRLVLLDLMRNPATRTTKTFASLVMVARAAQHVRLSGEPVLILTPSSANKATALRDAVSRAHRTGLVTPEELRIVTVVPDGARPKLWSSDLSRQPGSAARNPVCVTAPGAEPAAVKSLAREAAGLCADELKTRHGMNLWYSLDLANYRCADAVRAFAEHEDLPPRRGVSRVHVHSVSSAFGLLGHHFGRLLLEESVPPQYFLVQHLSTPDMVVRLHGKPVPDYRYDPGSGLHRQDADPRFPAITFAPDENLEPTFYTRDPVTSPTMNEIIRRQGGGGIVVSLHECLARYARVRELLAAADVRLPADPRRLREWSLVMAMTGVLNAVERGLVTADEIVVHGSGSYSDTDFTPIPPSGLHQVADAAGLRDVVMAAAVGAARAGSC